MAAAMSTVVRTFVLSLSVLVGVSCTSEAHSSGAEPKPLKRGTFFVAIEEKLDGEKPADEIAAHLIKMRMLLHGFQLAPDAASARYLIDGTIDYEFHQELKKVAAGK